MGLNEQTPRIRPAAAGGPPRRPRWRRDPGRSRLGGRRRDGKVDLSVVVPCYNEQEVLDELHRRVTAVCGGLGLSYELILVNDGSRDGTWVRMLALAARDPRLVLVNLSRNHGHQLALTAGLRLSRGRRVLILDADLQDPPELLPEMLRRMDAGADVVYGLRRVRVGESAFKRVTARLFYDLIERLTDVPIPRDAGDFRLISRRALDLVNAMPERHRFLRGMISWVGYRQEPILYDRPPRLAGETKYPVRKMVRFALDAIASSSVKPLALASWCGAVAGLGSAPLLAYSLVSWLAWGTAAGWASLLAATTLIGGVQLLAIGIIGEYLGRIYEQLQGRPLFVIDQVLRSDSTGTLSGGRPQHRGDLASVRGGPRALRPRMIPDPSTGPARQPDRSR